MRIIGKSFLVIGGAGFIGSHVVDQLLEAGAARVRIYDNFSRGTRHNLHQALRDSRAEIFADGGDILHEDVLHSAMQGMDGAFHLAALWLLDCVKYPRSAFEVNVVGTMNVIEEAIAAGVKRLVYSSSASVYGNAVSEPIDEDHPFNCEELYGASKVCGEMLMRALYNTARQRASCFKYIGLRYMNVYGPRQDDKGAYTGVVTRMLNALDAGECPVIHGDGSQSYDFIDVRDCARANISAMESEVTDRCFNVGTGIKTSIAELVGRLTALHGSHLSARFEPTGARPFVRSRVGSTVRARKEIDFSAEILLEQGLRDLIAHRKRHTADAA